MSKDFHEKDPLYQFGKRHEQQRLDDTMKRVQQWGEYEHAIQRRISGFLLFGLPQKLWQYSRISIFLYVAPFSTYIFFIIAVSIGLSSQLSNAIWFYCLGILLFVAMVGSMIYGFLQAVGFVRIVAGLQVMLATLFSIIATYRAAHVPAGRIPFGVRSADCAIAMVLMLLLFGITVVTDLVRQFLNKRSME
jgi:hypothetical protein